MFINFQKKKVTLQSRGLADASVGIAAKNI
jgi:hypothetical protein